MMPNQQFGQKMDSDIHIKSYIHIVLKKTSGSVFCCSGCIRQIKSWGLMTRQGETLPGRQLGNLVTAQDSSDDIDLSGCRAETLLLRSNKLTIENHRKSWKIMKNHGKS